MTHHIVLAHGVLGFGDSLEIPSPFAYFRDVAIQLAATDRKIHAPQVPSTGGVTTRGQILANFITKLPQGRVDIIAHSMGGLDARYAISNFPAVAARVKSLTTIGTPHDGSPVANAVYDVTHPLAKYIPAFITAYAGALKDLTTVGVININRLSPNIPGIYYMNIAGDAPVGQMSVFSGLASILREFNGEINDGLVLKSSAQHGGHKVLPDWPVDHAGEIGWRTGFFNPIRFNNEHLARYEDLMKRILALN